MTRIAAALVTLLLVAAACGDDDDDASTSSSSSTTTTTDAGSSSTTGAAEPTAVPALKLTQVAHVDQPIALAVRKGTDGFYVAEKSGGIQYVSAPGASAEQVLDISDEISTGNEQGLLGLTFSPDGSTMYISYTNTDGDTRVQSVDPDSGTRTDFFGTDQPYPNHNGGNIIFGPDGFLWMGLGDGGAGGDPQDRAQNPDTVLGKILRFDPKDPKPQIWSHGMRNPWRFSFDRDTDDLWVGDVGQDAWEEVDHVPAGTPPGSNFGWPQSEGTHGYKDLHPADGSVIPVYEYDHGDGQSVVGGFVYRGSAIPQLDGIYLFTDTYTARLWALLPKGDAYAFADTGIDVPDGLVSSFGQDADGELYVLSLGGGVYRIDAA